MTNYSASAEPRQAMTTGMEAGPIQEYPGLTRRKREEILRALLDPRITDGGNNHFGNYEYARDNDYESGLKSLIRLFDFNPKIGRDGLLHTLIGSAVTKEDGKTYVVGFHHEPSGIIFGGRRVGRITTGKRAFEPYNAESFVENMPKGHSYFCAETGEFRQTTSSFFPKEYDALAVLQAIRQAYKTHGPAEDTKQGNLKCKGTAIMLDNSSTMAINLQLNPRNKKIISAYPTVGHSDVMNLSTEDVVHWLDTPAATIVEPDLAA